MKEFYLILKTGFYIFATFYTVLLSVLRPQLVVTVKQCLSDCKNKCKNLFYNVKCYFKSVDSNDVCNVDIIMLAGSIVSHIT